MVGEPAVGEIKFYLIVFRLLFLQNVKIELYNGSI